MSMSDQYSPPSKCLDSKFSSKSDEVLSLGPICLNIDFSYKVLKDQRQIRTQHLQIDYCTNFQENLVLFLGPVFPKF